MRILLMTAVALAMAGEATAQCQRGGQGRGMAPTGAQVAQFGQRGGVSPQLLAQLAQRNNLQQQMQMAMLQQRAATQRSMLAARAQQQRGIQLSSAEQLARRRAAAQSRRDRELARREQVRQANLARRRAQESAGATLVALR